MKPMIRFKEFNDAWEKQYFQNLVSRKKTAQYDTKNRFVVELENIKSEIGTLVSNDIRSDDKISTGIKFKKNNILYGKLRPYLKKWYIADKEGIALGDFWVFQSQNLAPLFIYYLIQTYSFQYVSNLTTGTKMPRSDWNIVKNTPFLVPSVKESSNIGEFIYYLDKLISLYERKLKLLELIKKSLLQKLFVNNNFKYPEIRFKEFNDAWEKQKLGKLVDIMMGVSPSSKNYTMDKNHPILVQGNADIKKEKIIGRVRTKEITKLAPKYSTLLTVRAPVGDVYIASEDVVIGRGIAALSENKFIYYMLRYLKLNHYWDQYSTGSTFESINKSDIYDVSLYVPNNKESEQIIYLLNNIFCLNTLYERKIDLLEALKKEFLKNMLI